MAVVRRIPGGCVFVLTLFLEVKQESILLWCVAMRVGGKSSHYADIKRGSLYYIGAITR